MPRVSRKEAERHRQEVVAAAAALFRERGIGGVSVPELMAAAGMTHGGFYKHFASKNALAAEAIGAAADEVGQRVAGTAAAHRRDANGPRGAVIASYLSERHRDDPGHGCPTAAFIDHARAAESADLDRAYLSAVERMVATLESLAPDQGRDGALATLATMVGGLLLARATAGSPLSDAFLSATRQALGAPAERDTTQAVDAETDLA